MRREHKHQYPILDRKVHGRETAVPLQTDLRAPTSIVPFAHLHKTKRSLIRIDMEEAAWVLVQTFSETPRGPADPIRLMAY